MSVKIFLPIDLFYAKENCAIYGEIKINENNAVSYFVIAAAGCSSHYKFEVHSYDQLRHLGHIVNTAEYALEQQQLDVALSFNYDVDTPNIYLNKLSIKPPLTTHANVFLYEPTKVLQLHDCARTFSEHTQDDGDCDDHAAEQCDDIRMLWDLLDKSQQHTVPKTRYRSIVCIGFNYSLDLMTRAFTALMECRLVDFLIRRTVLYDHYGEWKKFNASGKRNANIILDRVLGICVMLILLFFIPNQGDYLIQASHFIIGKLRLLLEALKGSPIGLKLNIHLNNFLLDCFSYHIDLWAKFLNMIEPVLSVLFVPVAFLGSMGLSYQLALLSDLILLIGLHAHCFYIYSAVLYKVEIRGLQVLWKVVIGKRRNLLKNRVEAHNYKNRQLYLATLFFTSLLFLFPTVLVYYIVFTTLRLCIYTANLLLLFHRRHILEFPLHTLCRWLIGNLFAMESIQLQHINHVPSPLLQPAATQTKMSAFKIKVQSSSLAHVFSCKSGVLQELTAKEQTSIKHICSRILEGKF